MLNRMLLLLILLAADTAAAETVELTLPGKASLKFDTPRMAKLKEVGEGDSYQYIASSIEDADRRFNLSVFVEPINCHFGESLREVTRCFLERSDLVSGIVKESRSTRCDEIRCEVIYVTATKIKESGVVQMHTNTMLVYRNLWVDIHFSVMSPTVEDRRIFAELADSLSFVEQAN